MKVVSNRVLQTESLLLKVSIVALGGPVQLVVTD